MGTVGGRESPRCRARRAHVAGARRAAGPSRRRRADDRDAAAVVADRSAAAAGAGALLLAARLLSSRPAVRSARRSWPCRRPRDADRVVACTRRRCTSMKLPHAPPLRLPEAYPDPNAVESSERSSTRGTRCRPGPRLHRARWRRTRTSSASAAAAGLLHAIAEAAHASASAVRPRNPIMKGPPE